MTADRSAADGSGATVLVAEAKLTLSLRVTGVRADGYHLLDSEMVTVDLADRLEVAEGGGLTLATEFGPVRGTAGGAQSGPDTVGTGPDNLVARALVATGRTARVHLVKRVPPGAGLGGGSADAAAILRWAGATDPGLAARLGADVPFCLTGGRALVRGIGDEVVPLPFVERAFVLVLLPFGVETAAVYRAWDELAAGGDVVPTGTDPEGRPGPEINDLETAAEAVEPRLATWRHFLHERTGRAPHLAGSGSTWFLEGTPDELCLEAGRPLVQGGEQAVAVPVRTTPGVGPG